ncbi:pyridoxamine 5'-phosphate oxidase family protein [Luteipulveratus sp. YIM 133132]|uniref:pyridoxamine 5'-phosphate oxidase family protein n=1 Tax=Luteipulveratus flavus TaxID=3031728 RepID=UPI0023AF234A|nr:pyridoxamine 5'-phosphate oxidase family protein [Luteipulveratus sp. YIM 133132]MDE9365641.1 pyridoxamine 5'-phosphate oxidase family protein [Luteipulveratus sp. YIM 133132]
MAEAGTPEKVAELVKDVKVAMLTFVDPSGRLMSKPMATQDVDFSGDIWFIGERDSHKSRAIQQDSRVNVAYAGRGTWVSVAGRAEVVDDVARLKDLWNTFTDAWLEGGPENPNNVLIHVAGESAEYWDSPGGKVVQVANLVKAKATGERYEGENEQVEL